MLRPLRSSNQCDEGDTYSSVPGLHAAKLPSYAREEKSSTFCRCTSRTRLARARYCADKDPALLVALSTTCNGQTLRIRSQNRQSRTKSRDYGAPQLGKHLCRGRNPRWMSPTQESPRYPSSSDSVHCANIFHERSTLSRPIVQSAAMTMFGMRTPRRSSVWQTLVDLEWSWLPKSLLVADVVRA